ncbi:MAG: type 2 isopentenyl-diphosphate Delta-isomerase [Bdellovibrionota bacterium]
MPENRKTEPPSKFSSSESATKNSSGSAQNSSSEAAQTFEQRKADHIQLSMDPRTQTSDQNYLDFLQLIPEALPEINFSEVTLDSTFHGLKYSAPFYIGSMTAGHQGSLSINRALSKLSHDEQILMGVGSQRKELFDPTAAAEWKQLRQEFPKVRWAGNVGITQLITSTDNELLKLRDHLQAEVFFIHLNALQEALQKEGTPQFRGGLKALEKAVKILEIPVVLKEVGCGIAAPTLEKLRGIGLAAVDVNGKGGTHWGRIETYRHDSESLGHDVGETFKNWGLSTLECLLEANSIKSSRNLDYEIWASGGVRSGLDVAKFIALGAQFIGIAQPWLAACLAAPEESDTNLKRLFQRVKKELQIALFITGCKTPEELRRRQPWAWNTFLKASQNSTSSKDWKP